MDRPAQPQVGSGGDLNMAPKADRAAGIAEDDDSCLADGLMDASDEEIEEIEGMEGKVRDA